MPKLGRVKEIPLFTHYNMTNFIFCFVLVPLMTGIGMIIVLLFMVSHSNMIIILLQARIKKLLCISYLMFMSFMQLTFYSS